MSPLRIHCIPSNVYIVYANGTLAAIAVCMIKRTKQNWSVGATVKVGFLSLVVIGMIDIKDGLPDIYLLERAGQFYEFIPHNGLTKVTAQGELDQWARRLQS